MDRLSDDDLRMLRQAVDALREPQAVLRFVQAQIAARYGLGPQDSVDPLTGSIERGAESDAGSQ